MTTRGKKGKKTKSFQFEVMIMFQTCVIMVQTTFDNGRIHLAPFQKDVKSRINFLNSLYFLTMHFYSAFLINCEKFLYHQHCG